MGAKTSDSTVQAAGRQISSKNATRLSKAFAEIGKLLIDAGVVDKQSLESLFGEENTTAKNEPEVSVEADAQAPIAAAAGEESFTTQVKRVTWHDRLRTTLRFFGNRYEMLHNCPENDFARRVGVDTDRETAIAQLRDDLIAILVELTKDHPGPSDSDSGYYYSPYMELASSSGEKVITVAFDCPTQAIAAAASRTTNRRPVEGVLFRIDEPSESAPSVGPGLPLYVPKAVAEEALSTVSGLPLDAHDNLSQHSNPDIAGVMLSAAIQGNDFTVSGYLYDWSQSDKVAKIAANKEQLGMSMNANAIGHEAEVEGRKVFWVDKLELLGANILFSEKATYRQTRLLSAGGFDDTPTSPEGHSGTETPAAQIAAASSDSPNPSGEDKDMTVDSEVKQQLADMSKTVGDLASMIKDIVPAVQSVQTGLQTVQAQVTNIEKEREDNRAAIAAQAQQQQQQEQQQQFMATLQTAIKDAVSTEVSAAVAKAVNPSGQPARKTVSLAAQANGTGGAVDQPQMQALLQLASLEGELAALRKNPSVDGFEEIKLVDKIAQHKREYQLA
ncbi:MULTISPECIES: hypothetical protein [Trichocoleus]|uniref:Uncharacterized protein n=1 Tax=Trichocoleus desertorum GB2-A4 TaxID=2933944 RepID=A0ABV0JE85_9CYAN|nr:hypothetical protein [Trichocoleus sp. FACHB-46]MBD1864251.1 hypothetical protein [Trichocoleus sp. FACHB-46]